MLLNRRLAATRASPPLCPLPHQKEKAGTVWNRSQFAHVAKEAVGHAFACRVHGLPLRLGIVAQKVSLEG